MTYGIIGIGTMGSALAGALLRIPATRVIATTRSAASAQAAADRLGIGVATDNVALTRASDVVLLCIKPYQARAVLADIAGELDGKLLISICAALTTADLEAWSGGRCAVIRAMPNTPAVIGAGMTVLAAGATAGAEQLAAAETLFGSVGRTAVVAEALMDAATGLSGCGPAYVFLIIEALAEAGVKLGMNRTTSTLLAAQTVYGAADLVLQRNAHPATLKDEVTTPAGCTIDGLLALENGGLRSTLVSGVVAAAQRSRSLREESRAD